MAFGSWQISGFWCHQDYKEIVHDSINIKCQFLGFQHVFAHADHYLNNSRFSVVCNSLSRVRNLMVRSGVIFILRSPDPKLHDLWQKRCARLQWACNRFLWYAHQKIYKSLFSKIFIYDWRQSLFIALFDESVMNQLFGQITSSFVYFHGTCEVTRNWA